MRRALAVIVGFVIGACSSTPPAPATGNGTGAEPTGTFAAFVIDVVVNKTADDAEAMELEVLDELADPDMVSDNDDAYATLFDEP